MAPTIFLKGVVLIAHGQTENHFLPRLEILKYWNSIFPEYWNYLNRLGIFSSDLKCSV